MAMAEKQASRSMARVVIASSAGTAFEWYDFFIFGSLAPVISKVFFSGARPDAGADCRARFVRGRLRLPAARRFDLRGGRRPAWPQGRVPRHGQPDGQRDIPDRTASDLCPGRRAWADPADHPAHRPGHCAWAANMAAPRSTSPNMRPTTAAAASPAGSSRRHRSACLRRCWSSSPPEAASARTRSQAGAGGSRSWPRRCCSAFRCGCARKLAESPHFARLKEAGEVTKAPLREAFTRREQSEAGADCLLRDHGGAGRRLVFRLLLPAGLPREISRRPGCDQGPAADDHDRGQRAALRLLRMASDRVGRKPVMVGGMLLALMLYFPARTGLPRRRTRRWSPPSARRR